MKYYLLIGLLSLGFCSFGAIKSVHVEFYSENIIVEYPSEIILPGLVIVEDISLMDYFKRMEDTPYQSFVDDLLTFKENYHLNDWLYYELLQATVDKIFTREGYLKKELTLWYLLTKSGFDTRISYVGEKIYIYTWSDEDVFETPMIIDQERRFINLSSINSSKQSPAQLKMLLFRPGAEGKSFSFKMEVLPLLSANVKNREINFRVKEQPFKIGVKLDATLYEIMKNYPAIAEQEYFNIPMSEITYGSLIPKLKFMVKDKSVAEALTILIGFTRTGFQYKDDNDVFGRSKPMIAEELFHYKYSDCEDRSALFYFLVKEILDLPMLILAYPDHLTIAVATDEIKGQPFLFNNKKYYICDPTGPAGSNIMGVPPNGYENVTFEIIGGYNE